MLLKFLFLELSISSIIVKSFNNTNMKEVHILMVSNIINLQLLYYCSGGYSGNYNYFFIQSILICKTFLTFFVMISFSAIFYPFDMLYHFSVSFWNNIIMQNLKMLGCIRWSDSWWLLNIQVLCHRTTTTKKKHFNSAFMLFNAVMGYSYATVLLPIDQWKKISILFFFLKEQMKVRDYYLMCKRRLRKKL